MDNIRIRDYREYMGLTQDEVAKHIGVHKQTVSKWERGKHKITKKSLDKLMSLWYNYKLVDEIKKLRIPIVRGRPFQKRSENESR